MRSGLYRKLSSTIILLFLILITAFSEENGPKNSVKKPVLVILPLFSKDVPAYIPKVVDKLLEAKLDKIHIYTIMPDGEVNQFLVKQGIELKTEPQLDYLKKYSELIDADQVMYGIIRSENNEYKLATRIYDVKKKEIVLRDTEIAANIRKLDVAADKITRKIITTLFPPAVVTKAEKLLNKAADTKKEAQVKQNLEDFAAIAEKNPEKALSLVSEPARKALENTVKEKVKKEVVHEEIQNLFEKEKKEKALALKRKWQLWITFSLETLNQVGNLFGSLAEYERINSLLYWNKYMNNVLTDDPYNNYQQSVSDFGGFLSQKYVFSGLGNIGIGIGLNYMLVDSFTFSSTGKYLFSVFYGLNNLGNAVATLTDQLSFFSLRKYLEYTHVTSDFTAKYNAYRDSLVFSTIARYTTYGLWSIGYTGMVVAALLPGDRSPMIVSQKARRLLSWGSGLIGFGNITSGLALNYRGKAEESWITDTSPSGAIGDSLTNNYTLTADILTYSSYVLLVGGSVLSVVGLLLPAEEETGNSQAGKNVSFNVVPSSEGTSLVVRLRLE